ncbi:MAG: alanine--tRNA ligase [Rickettsiales bacterium]|nr:alanine--tRNA ligase [Rickettsiales bacterium]
MFTVSEIREKYLKFFEKKGCKIIKSSSLVPEDPTLLFTNAGMVQFKNYFKGVEKPKFNKAVSVQKCVRAGGKHNDLDNVGYTARHHTFFEMLGNFSFGDYFKKEAITWAWEFLTKELLIPQEKLVVTVYHTDDEAYNIWKNTVGLPEDKIIKISTKDNFWEMGDTGPCGPCSEIFYDHGEEVTGGLPGTPEEDGDRYIEVWNIVFTQFNRNEKGELDELPSKNIDTGMGLERISAVLQGVHNNYDIDLFQKLINNSKNIIGDGDIFCHRIIADHLRSSSFLIADGVLPSNEGRGYVLRRIMRRAMLQIHKLGCKSVSMYKLVPCLVDLMGESYPELKEYETLIMDTLKLEEERFRLTLEKGLRRLDEEIEKYYNA